jgi:hypothetical protein
MILFQRKSKIFENLKTGLRNEPYLIINLVFALLILAVFIYSALYSPDKNNYPVVCIHEKITGMPCFSCGLSHSFSLIIRGRIDEAFIWNVYGMQVFLFFVSQLFLRAIFSLFFLKFPSTQKQLIILDAAGSGLIFLLTFWPFILNILKGVYSSL